MFPQQRSMRRQRPSGLVYHLLISDAPWEDERVESVNQCKANWQRESIFQRQTGTPSDEWRSEVTCLRALLSCRNLC